MNFSSAVVHFSSSRSPTPDLSCCFDYDSATQTLATAVFAASNYIKPFLGCSWGFGHGNSNDFDWADFTG